jgi:hypothetical protein
MSKSCINRPSTPNDKADPDLGHHSNGLLDCFPISLFGRWKRSQSLPLHHEEHYYHPDTQAAPSTSSSQTVVPYSTTPLAREDINMPTCGNSTCSSTARAEDDCNRDPPGLSNEISDFVVVTSVEFERYERNFTSYVLIISCENHECSFDTVRQLTVPVSRSHRCFK